MKKKGSNKPSRFISLGVITLVGWTLVQMTACKQSSDCVDCGGGLIEGYLYKTVSTEDLASMPELEIESCIRFRYLALSDNEIDPETVSVMDDCCCKEYEID